MEEIIINNRDTLIKLDNIARNQGKPIDFLIKEILSGYISEHLVETNDETSDIELLREDLQNMSSFLSKHFTDIEREFGVELSVDITENSMYNFLSGDPEKNVKITAKIK